MARKRKKKVSNQHHQAMLRAYQKREFAAYFRKIEEMAAAFGASGILDLIPKKEQAFFFSIRLRPPKVTTAKGTYLSNSDLQKVQAHFDKILTEEYFTVPNTNIRFTLMDFLTTTRGLSLWINQIDENSIPRADELRKLLEPIHAFERGADSPYHQYKLQLAQAASCISEYGSTICEITTDHEVRKHNKFYIAESIVIKTEKIQPKNIKIKDGKRVIFPHVNFFDQSAQATLNVHDFYPKKGANKEYPVFYQVHAFRRMEERMDCFQKPELMIHLQLSLYKPEIKMIGKNRALLSYFIGSIKLGYFLLEIVQEIVIFRTFLFITNDGTTEGKLLRKHLGLCKVDKQYIHLDKCSTFLLSDIYEDPDLKRALDNAGCGELLLLNQQIQKNDRWDQEFKTGTAAHVRDFLMMDAVA